MDERNQGSRDESDRQERERSERRKSGFRGFVAGLALSAFVALGYFAGKYEAPPPAPVPIVLATTADGLDSGFTVKVKIEKASDNVPDCPPPLAERIDALKQQLDLVGIRDEINAWHRALPAEQQVRYERIQQIANDGVTLIEFIAGC
ncbi:MAG TPA: hypothetical protein PKE27_08575 [Povalibacter sp.]|uniref:hypothetical protein n=1 Tax=Povalibacter sp. TaxID=1962978 RepID=UPI002BA8C2B5|nr:hypothetical protein [Povalibacter sp.]HMN44612.1 hypothetical protein [Povalibacter sp.]